VLMKMTSFDRSAGDFVGDSVEGSFQFLGEFIECFSCRWRSVRMWRASKMIRIVRVVLDASEQL